MPLTLIPSDLFIAQHNPPEWQDRRLAADEEDFYRRRAEVVKKLVEGRGHRLHAANDPDLREIDGYECNHCGAIFELGKKHYQCRVCEGALCYPACSPGACPANDGYGIYSEEDGDAAG